MKLVPFFIFLSFFSHPAFAVGNIDKRPLRIGIMRFNHELDRTKPLAEADYSGWAVNGDMLIGAIDDTWVAGYSLKQGKIIWWIKGPSSLASPVVSFDNTVVLGFRDGKVWKVEAATGKKIWDATLDSFSSRLPVLSGNRMLILTSSQQLYAIDFQTGTTSWIYDAGFPEDLTMAGGAPPYVHEDQIYIGLSSGEVQAISLDSGKVLWNQEPEAGTTRFRDVIGEMVVRDGRLLVARYDGLVSAIEISGSERGRPWQEHLPTISSTAFFGGVFYVGCLNGDLIAFEGTGGKRLWKVATGQVISAITPGESVVYVSGGNGRINAIHASSGKPMWHDDIGNELVRKPIFFENGVYFSTGYKNLYGYVLD